MASNNRSHYGHVFSQWSTKALGPQPTEALLAIAHVFGRPGKQALGIAMALRPDGMTGAQMCGASALFDGKPTPCRNKLIGSTGLVAVGLFKREPMTGGAIKLSITPKGEAWVKQAASADAAKPAKAAKAAPSNGKAAKPAKAAKAPRKPRAVKAPAAEQPAPAVEAPAAEPQADQPQS